MVTERDQPISEETAEKLATMIVQVKHLVGFTGAGISTESGLADFRGPDGVWTRQDKRLSPPKSRRMEDVRPNKAHIAVADLMLIIGYSLVVTPAAELPLITKRNGGKIVIINKGETALDKIADIRIWAGARDTLEKVMKKIQAK